MKWKLPQMMQDEYREVKQMDEQTKAGRMQMLSNLKDKQAEERNANLYNLFKKVGERMETEEENANAAEIEAAKAKAEKETREQQLKRQGRKDEVSDREALKYLARNIFRV